MAPLAWILCATWARDGTTASSLVQICVPFSSSLGEYPDRSGVLRYCIRNSWKDSLDGNLDFLGDFLHVNRDIKIAVFRYWKLHVGQMAAVTWPGLGAMFHKKFSHFDAWTPLFTRVLYGKARNLSLSIISHWWVFTHETMSCASDDESLQQFSAVIM